MTNGVTVDVRIAGGVGRVAYLRLCEALGALPSVIEVVAAPPGSERLRLTARSLPALLTEMPAAPALAGAGVTWNPDDGVVLWLQERSLGTPGQAPGQSAGQGRMGSLHSEGIYIPPKTVSVIIPAHNEEAVIEATLRSVLAVFRPEDVFVFCDGCTDQTVPICRRYLPAENVIDNPHNVGKSKGLEWTLEHRIYPRGYAYTTIIDADTTMDPRFLINTLKVLRKKDVACTVGQVKSRWYANNLISVYRTFLYVLWQMLYKRLQSVTNAITIASGCSTTWKTRVLRQLTFDHQMSTEDFDLTMQVHRKHLGKIKYVSSAIVWTQDPFSVRSYRRQIYRWDRAWWESVRKYRVGLRWLRFKKGLPAGLSILDISTLLLVFDILMFTFSVVVLPVFLLRPIAVHIGPVALDSRQGIASMLAWQYGSILASAAVVAIIERRPRILVYSPLFVFLMYVDIFVSIQALMSTIRRQYRAVKAQPGASVAAWISPERREVA
jgi:biofilm PGA synthesis N-glycosyltransferase PgaC